MDELQVCSGRGEASGAALIPLEPLCQPHQELPLTLEPELTKKGKNKINVTLVREKKGKNSSL